MKHYGLVILPLAVLLSLGAAAQGWNRQKSHQDAAATVSAVSVNPAPTSTPAVLETVSTPVPTPLPASFQLSVPYTMQAPFNKWDPLHEDACEETSLVMVRHFLTGTPIGTPEQADQEITDLVHWEEQHGYGPSITLAQLNQVAAGYYGLTHGRVVALSNPDELRQAVAAGQPLILGMAGKQLPNPYFSSGGPNYHMLVVKGYDATGFLTNEPGTWHGDGFHYDYGVFFTAVHDWNAQNILLGAKEYLVFGNR